jgi:hypothetical protein
LPWHNLIMADSDALRSRRKRLHAAGDHSLCRRCDARRAQLAGLTAAWDAAAVPVARVPARGSQDPNISPASETLQPKAMMEGLAQRLEEAHKADPPDSAVARELRMTLQALGGAGGGDDELSGFLGEFSGA